MIEKLFYCKTCNHSFFSTHNDRYCPYCMSESVVDGE